MPMCSTSSMYLLIVNAAPSTRCPGPSVGGTTIGDGVSRFLWTRLHVQGSGGNVTSQRCEARLVGQHALVFSKLLPIRPKCDCHHRFSFSPSLPGNCDIRS